MHNAYRRMVLGKTLVVLMLGLLAMPVFAEQARLKPYILGNDVPGDMAAVVNSVKSALKANGFEIAGSYAPYPNATVIVVTNAELKSAAGKAKHGGFGAGQRVAVTNVDGKLQVSYVNPAYIGAAYGLGELASVSAQLKAALGRRVEFGSEEGLTAAKLAPGVYHYMFSMPYFHQLDLLAKHDSYDTAIATIEKNLTAGKGGTVKVYRIDVAKEISVFGVGINRGDGPDRGAKDTDKEVMDIIDYGEYRATAYLPYEILVEGNEVNALRARFRIAVHFPDTKMAGDHGFTKIMSAPGGIKRALEEVAEAESPP